MFSASEVLIREYNALLEMGMSAGILGSLCLVYKYTEINH